MSKSKVPTKNKNSNEPNVQAQRLINECQEILEPGFLREEKILTLNKLNLNKLAHNDPSANIIVHEDGKGATIISSTGSVTIVGSEIVEVEKNDPFKANDSHHADAQFQYAVKKIGAFLNNDGVIDANEKNEILQLGEIMEEVAIMVTNDSKNVIIANNYGKNIVLTKASPMRK